MKTLQTTPPSLESVWATLQEIAQQQKENERILNEKFAETSRLIKETDQQQKELNAATDRRMKRMEKNMGGWTNSHGSFTEEYFLNSFEKCKKNFFGENFDKISKHVSHFWQKLEDEYDIVLYNHTSVAFIEVKYKAHLNDIPTVLKKAKIFRILCPHYKDSKIYLALASMSFYEELEQECIRQDIAVIKQVNDTVVIYDEHLKVF